MSSENSALSSDGVTDITQDSNGFVWVGTNDGLNRYDGVGFKSFGKNELGLQTSFIISLCADDEGNVWVGTDGGVTRYDYMSDSFSPLLIQSEQGTAIHNKVTCIQTDKNERVWFAVNNQGLFCYEPSENRLTNHLLNVLPAGITSFCIDDAGSFWMSLYFSGLWHCSSDLCNPEPFHSPGIPEGDQIMYISNGPRTGTLLLSSISNGLCELDVQRNSLRVIIPNDSGFVPEQFCFDRDNNAYLATNRGIWRYDFVSSSVSLLGNDENSSPRIWDSKVKTVFFDRSGSLWVGTSYNGVDFSGAFRNNFYRYDRIGAESIRGIAVRSMTTDEFHKNVWITTESGGLLHYDAIDGVLSFCKNSDLPDQMLGVCYDDGSLFIGTYGGIIRYDLSTGKVNKYVRLTDDANFRDNKIYAIFRTASGRILAGSTLGMMEYDRVGDSFRQLPGLDGVFVTDILEDSRSRLWVASYANGVFLYDLSHMETVGNWNSGDAEHFIPSNKINSIMEDTSGTIWAASFNGGFFSIGDIEPRIFNTETKSLSIPSDIACSMEEDNDSNLWISSAKGLMKFDRNSSRVVTYTVSDGLLDNAFSLSSSVRIFDGSLMFGSVNGLIRFNPKDLSSASSSSVPVFTDFMVRNTVITPARGSSVLDRNINEATRVVLPSGENSFSFTIAIPELEDPASGSVSVFLRGYDKDWSTINWNGRGIQFSRNSLPAGRYVLEVKTDTFSHTPLTIIVRRPQLLSVLAICIYLVILMAILFGTVRILTRRNRREVEKQSFEDKLTFFTNIIHEIKTPLTLIKTPLQNLKTLSPQEGEFNDDLQLISRNADYMDALVKEMLDFVRVEKQGYAITLASTDISDMIGQVCMTFSEAARNKNISLDWSISEEHMCISADGRALLKVLNNLLHNAIKYAETYIRVSLEERSGAAVVSIANDGPLIPQARREAIFKPFVQFSEENAPYSQSFGVGLSLARSIAKLHDGSLILADGPETCFVLTIPKGIIPDQQSIPVELEKEGERDVAQPLILLVEDNDDLRGFLKRKLNQQYRIIDSRSAEEALELVKSYSVDLIISDIALTGKSGIELCRAVNGDFVNSHVDFIILSALTTPEVKLEAMESMASLYIEKPFDMEYLLSSVRILLERRKKMQDSFMDEVHPDLRAFKLRNSDEIFLEKLDDVILANVEDPQYSVEQLSAALNLSISTFTRKVKGLLGTTPSDYLRMKRLAVAARMLENGNERISEVCYSVGFNTPSYFAKCFKAKYGVLPNEYSKNHKLV